MIPILFCIPFAEMGFIESAWKTVGYIFLLIFLILLGLKFLAEFVWNTRFNWLWLNQYPKFQMGLLAYFDLKDCGYIVNIVAFFTSYILIVWVYFNRPSSTTETE